MIFTYKECISKYGSDYLIKKEIEGGRLFQIRKGLYSENGYNSELEIISAKYPRAIFTLDSAFYFYGLTDVIPEKYVIATKRTDYRIKDEKIRQVFVNEDIFDIGKTTLDIHGTTINIYSRERLLVDLIRLKNKIPFDYYKEIILNYREIINMLDFLEIEKYASKFRTQKTIMNAVQLEVL